MKEYNVDISRLFAHMTSIMADSVTEKDEDLLYDYITRLKPIQYQSFARNVYKLIDRKTKGNKRAKITHNAIRLTLRIEEKDKNIRVFPFIEKLATKGWPTSDGTYSFSMPILISNGNDIDEYIENEIYSFGPIDKLVSKKNKIDIYGLKGDLIIDYK